MLRAIIIEDEELSREMLRGLIRDTCPEEVEVVGMAASAEEGRQMVVKYAPDIVFLDVEMPREDGFTFLESVHPRMRNFAVIFVTAHEHYALLAIKASAVDYLVKPVDIDELYEAVEKVKKLREQQPKPKVLDSFSKQIENVLTNLNAMHTSGGKPLRIMVPLHEGFEFMSCSDIVYCESDGAYTKFHLEAKPAVVISKPSSKFQDVLAAAGFMRIHRAYIVNPHYIKRYLRESDEKSSSYIVMTNGDKLEIARRRKTEVLEQIQKYNLSGVES
ncbi:MAG: LytTR family DNA-binding domain-containing protein [Bacteroidota bacterium]